METKTKEKIVKNISTILTVLFCVCALSVQWGVITSRLEIFGKQIEQLNRNAEKQSDKIDIIEKDVSYIKGKME